jgi:hypothetical protein
MAGLGKPPCAIVTQQTDTKRSDCSDVLETCIKFASLSLIKIIKLSLIPASMTKEFKALR